MHNPQAITAEVSPGELIDKITILEIKRDRIRDERKLANVKTELSVLCRTRDAAIPASPELRRLTDELRAINEALWDVEDELRFLEKQSDFGPRFIDLARAVYKTNDRRAEVKYEVNRLLQSRLFEEKSYSAA
jgi:hypothetical protein